MQEPLGYWNKDRPAKTAREAMIFVIIQYLRIKVLMYFNCYRTDFVKVVLYYIVRLRRNGPECTMYMRTSVLILGYNN